MLGVTPSAQLHRRLLGRSYVASGLVAVLFSTIVFMNPVGMRLVFGARSLAPFVAATLVSPAWRCCSSRAHAGELRRVRWLRRGVRPRATVIATGGNLVAMRNHNARIPTFPGTAWGMAYGALTAAIVATAQRTPWTFDARAPYLLSLAYLAVFGSIVAFGAYLTLLKRVGAGPSAFVAVSTPVIALALSTLFEGYRWTCVGPLAVWQRNAGGLAALMFGQPGFFAPRALPDWFARQSPTSYYSTAALKPGISATAIAQTSACPLARRVERPVFDSDGASVGDDTFASSRLAWRLHRRVDGCQATPQQSVGARAYRRRIHCRCERPTRPSYNHAGRVPCSGGQGVPGRPYRPSPLAPGRGPI
jgi:hypothetical protein